jgi:MSHA biogenesis protein MshJ
MALTASSNGTQGLRQKWQRLATKVDSLSLRERAIIFGAVAVLLFTLVNDVILDPEFAKQKQLSEQIKSNEQRMEQIQAEIRQTIKVQSDPDEEGRKRLTEVKSQSRQMSADLLEMQKGLVSPDKMSALLEDILKRNGNLRLVSLKTLPAASLGNAASGTGDRSGTGNPGGAAGTSGTSGTSGTAGTAGAAPRVAELPGAPAKVDGAAPAIPANPATPTLRSGGRETVKADTTPTLVYTHGVEIVVDGTYLDMMHYMAALEAMPWQIFWGRARLDVTSYPDSRLALTVYTLSLDKKWLNL